MDYYIIQNILLSIISVINFTYIFYTKYNKILITVGILWYIVNLCWLSSILIELTNRMIINSLKIFTALVSIITIILFYFVVKNINDINFLLVWSILILIFSIIYIFYIGYLGILYISQKIYEIPNESNKLNQNLLVNQNFDTFETIHF